MINNRAAIVTGASSGIGAAVARLLAREGATVVLAARRSDMLNRVAASIRAAGGACLPIPCDVTDRNAAEALIARTARELGRIDILINNAGRGHFASIEDTSDDVIDSMFAVNVYALWYTTRPALRQMRRQGSGHIVNIASMAGKIGFPFNSAYVAAKHACVGFTHALRLELAGTGIHASVVCPSGVSTGWASSTEGGTMLPLFIESGPIARKIAEEEGIELPPFGYLESADAVAGSILACIRAPVAEVYTHTGAREFVTLSASDPEGAERRQTPGARAERMVYERLRNPSPARE